jgi:two-component system chemotaxis response regulator CheB
LETQHVFVIGGSAGSIESLKKLLAQLPPDLKAAIFIVVHLKRDRSSHLATVLNKSSRLSVCSATDQSPIENGRVYVAPADFHLYLKSDKMRLIRGPLENHTRPAIDVLFRSAAVAYREYVTGVILSGMLDDGTVGLQAIKRCGGMAIVQSPEDASFTSMPEQAIANNDVDYVVPVSKMGQLLHERTQHQPLNTTTVPKELLLESQMVERRTGGADKMAQIGEMVPQSCPSCGGPLWEISDSQKLRYRCHIGHAFTVQALAETQDTAVEEALWIALRTLEERERLLKRISEDHSQKGLSTMAEQYRQRAIEAAQHAENIRQLIYSLGQSDTIV